MAAPTLPFESDGDDGASGLVLVDRWCYIANIDNATTAEGTTSTGSSIQVTFRAARPPFVSHICVHCPGLDFSTEVPEVISTDADLVLLCVPVCPGFIGHGRDWDYFVYSPRARRLDLLPNPNHRYLNDFATVLLSRDDGAWYVVAALGVGVAVYNGRRLIRWDFDLHLHNSSDSSSSEGWISKVMSVSDLVRDRLIPLPRSTEASRLYHETEKAIAIGGEGGTVAWVDLWRGIFFCDVLSECPALRDVPLPLPARGNWNWILLELDPYCFRDVIISRNRGSIKYIETESWSPSKLDVAPASYTQWVRKRSGKLRVVRDGWRATTWTMAIPVDFDSQPLDKCWHRHSEIDVKDVTLDASSACPSNLWGDMLRCGGKTTQMLKELQVSCPILSMYDDTVYLLSTIKCLPGEGSASESEVVLAVDVSKGLLRGVAELDVQRNFVLRDKIFSSDICRYLKKVTGTDEPSKQEQGEPSEVHVKN